MIGVSKKIEIKIDQSTRTILLADNQKKIISKKNSKRIKIKKNVNIRNSGRIFNHFLFCFRTE